MKVYVGSTIENIRANEAIRVKLDAVRDFTNSMIRKAVDDWFRKCVVGNTYHAYYKRGEIMIFCDLDDTTGWELAMTEKVSPAWTKEIAASRIRAAISNLPILPRHLCE